MKIGIFGDSFADNSTENPRFPIDESWIKHISDMGHDVTSFGRTGTSTYYSFTKFLEEYKNFDHIIFSYSSNHRMHHMPNGLEQLSFLFSMDEFMKTGRSDEYMDHRRPVLDKILEARAVNIDYHFDIYVKQKIFNDVNSICKNNNIKLVNILPFDSGNSSHSIKFDERQGSCLCKLVDVSLKELSITIGDSRWCHLSQENNKVLADIIIDSFSDNNVIDLSKHTGFVYDKNISKRYS